MSNQLKITKLESLVKDQNRALIAVEQAVTYYLQSPYGLYKALNDDILKAAIRALIERGGEK